MFRGAPGSPQTAAHPSGTTAPSDASPTAEPTAKIISMSATGDIVMGQRARPVAGRRRQGLLQLGHARARRRSRNGQPRGAAHRRHWYVEVRRALQDCHQFRVPPSYAAHLRDAGYHLLNQAHNHGNDYGPAGYRNTRTALEAQGGEGSDKTRVRPGTEWFLGENRGDRALSNNGRLGYGGILKVSIAADGTWAGGRFVSTYMNGAGRPAMDSANRGMALVRDPSTSDFASTRARFESDGRVSAPVAA
jgi:hypothetical protein